MADNNGRSYNPDATSPRVQNHVPNLTSRPSPFPSELISDATSYDHDTSVGGVTDESSIPSEFRREYVGTSIVEPGSILVPESGRSYHGYKDGKYLLPNDPAEQERLDLQHAAFVLFLEGKLSMAPFSGSPRNVLDVATGTGIWAQDFAEQHPGSMVIGSDLSAIQPPRTLSNCSFVQGDAEEKWCFGHKFDYVHLRFVLACFDNDMTMLREAFKNMNPGGWIEYQDSAPLESDAEIYQSSPLKTWVDLSIQGATNAGRDIYKPRHYKKWLLEAGFIDVTETVLELPCQPWHEDPRLKKVGQYMATNLGEGIRGIGWKFLQAAGLSAPEIEALCLATKNGFKDPIYRVKCQIYIVYGRKPFERELD